MLIASFALSAVRANANVPSITFLLETAMDQFLQRNLSVEAARLEVGVAEAEDRRPTKPTPRDDGQRRESACLW